MRSRPITFPDPQEFLCDYCGEPVDGKPRKRWDDDRIETFFLCRFCAGDHDHAVSKAHVKQSVDPRIIPWTPGE